MSDKRCVQYSVFSILTGGEEKGQGKANSLIFPPPTPTQNSLFEDKEKPRSRLSEGKEGSRQISGLSYPYSYPNSNSILED